MGLFGKSKKEKEEELRLAEERRLAEEKRKQEEEKRKIEEERAREPVVYLYAILPGCIPDFPNGLIEIGSSGKLRGVARNMVFHHVNYFSSIGIPLPRRAGQPRDLQFPELEQVVDFNNLVKIYVDNGCQYPITSATYVIKDMQMAPIPRPGKNYIEGIEQDHIDIITTIAWDPERKKPFYVIEFRRRVKDVFKNHARYRFNEVRRRQFLVKLETSEGKRFDEDEHLAVLPAQPFMMGEDGYDYSEIVVFSALKSDYSTNGIFVGLTCQDYDALDDMVFSELRRLNIKRGDEWKKEDVERFMASLNRDDAEKLMQALRDGNYDCDWGVVLKFQENNGSYIMTESGEEIVWNYQMPDRTPDIIIGGDLKQFVDSKLEGHYLA